MNQMSDNVGSRVESFQAQSPAAKKFIADWQKWKNQQIKKNARKAKIQKLKNMAKDFFKNNWFRLALIAVLLLFCFVYALNNRYMNVSDHFAFDKWTQKGYLIRYDGVFAIDKK